MTQNPPDATVGLLESSERLLDWSSGAGLKPTCELLLSALQQATAPADYLGTVLGRIRLSANLLRSWSAAGDEIYGLARLATALETDPTLIDALGAGTRAIARDVLKDFRGSSTKHYLYGACVARDPVDANLKGWFDALRMWLLVHGLERASRAEPVVRDGRLADACTRVRMACEETAFLDWLPLFIRIRAGTDSWRLLNLHFDGAPGRYGPDLDAGDRTDAQRGFLRALARVARKEVSKTEPAQPACFIFNRAEICDTEDETPIELGTDSSEGGLRLKPLPLLDGDDEEELVEEGNADPNAAVAIQALAARYVQLLTGASARLLPWDWATLTPPETARLRQRMKDALDAPESDIRLLASITWLAMTTGRSLDMASRLQLGFEPDSEWRVSIRERHVHRSPPRRPGHWQPDGEQQRHIRPAADRLAITMPNSVAAVLAERFDAAKASTTVADLWRSSTRRPLLESFISWIDTDPALSRITQGMLAGVQARALYGDRGDHVAARLLVASPSAGLPAACAYTPYTLSSLPKVDGLHWDVPDDTNVAGSLLDPEDDFLRKGFLDAHARLRELAGAADPLVFHNALTAYWDAALRAATGIRPFAARWTRRDALDVGLEFVVVNDKPSLRESRVRLVPLPGGLLSQFAASYLPHTEALRRWLSSQGVDVDKFPASQRLHEEPSTEPMLFTVQIDGSQLVIHPAAHQIGSAALCPEAPLPANVYRHRLRNWLHRCGSDPEVIDSVIGHQDGATLTHGDHSMRSWQLDADAIRSDVASAYAALDIQSPPDFAGWDVATIRVDSGTCRPSPELRRAIDESVVVVLPWPTRLRVARLARLCIEASLANPHDSGRLKQKELVARLSQIDEPAEVERIGKQLMRTPKGVPSVHGPLQYAYFLRLIERAWEVHGKRVPMRRRYYDRPEDRSPFTRHAAGALAHRAALRTILEATLEGLLPSKLTAEQAVWVAVLDLALYSAVADPLLVEAVRSTVQFRVIAYREANWLEWNADGDVLRVDAPIQRIRVTRRCAHALLRILTAQRNQVQRNSAPPRQFAALVQALGLRSSTPIDSFGSAVFQLTSLINQCNAIELPGSVGAFLSGRTRSTSLHWGEWLAVRHGEDRATAGWSIGEIVPSPRGTANESAEGGSRRHARAARSLLQLENVNQQERPDGQRSAAANTSRGQNLDGSALVQQQTARKFFRAIYRILAKPARLESSIKGRNGKLPPAYRRSMQRKIEALVREEGGSVSSAVAALGGWCASLFDRDDKKELLRESSIERYLGALAPRFVSCAFGTDLAAMDADDIEALYCTFLETAGRAKVGYIYRRLREFHRHAETELSLPPVDWSEIAPDEAHSLSSPGFVSERDYRRILLALERRSEMSATHRHAAVTLVILAFRFGLRGSEALGLRCNDLRHDGNSQWLVVEGNRFRALKTDAGRRLVPLTQHLHALEAAALQRQMRQSTVSSIGLKDVGLFCDPDAPSRLLDWELLRRETNAIIKHATQRPHLTLHHLRHSYATGLWAELELAHRHHLDWLSNEWRARAAESRRRLVGPGPTRPDSRRTPWAIARALGHAHPRTTLYSYVHLLADAAEGLAFVANADDWTMPAKSALDLSVLGRRTRQMRDEGTGTAQEQLKLVDVLDMLSRLDAGVPHRQLPALWPISADMAARMARLLLHVERVLRLDNQTEVRSVGNVSTNTGRYAKLATSGLMAHVMGAAFQRLREALGVLYSDEARRQFAAIRLTDSEFGGMFGARRNISMYYKPQFALVRSVVELLAIDRSRLRLGAPDNLSNPMRLAAAEAGWLAPSSENSPRVCGGFNLNIRPGVEIDEVRFGIAELQVPQRLVLSLERDDKAKVCTRWDLILALVATVPLLNFRPDD